MDSLDKKPNVEKVEYWRKKYEAEHKITIAQKAEIDKLKHEVLELKLAREKSYAKRKRNELWKLNTTATFIPLQKKIEKLKIFEKLKNVISACLKTSLSKLLCSRWWFWNAGQRWDLAQSPLGHQGIFVFSF